MKESGDSGGEWRKRQPLPTVLLEYEVVGAHRIFNFLQSNDSSFRDVDVVVPNSIAATESALFNFTVTNLGFTNQTAADLSMSEQVFGAFVKITCTFPDPGTSGASVSQVALTATFNGTRLSDDDVAAASTAIVTNGASDIVIDWTLPLLNISDSATISFIVDTNTAVQDGLIECFADIENLLDENQVQPSTPLLFENGTINATESVPVQRRVDLAVALDVEQGNIIADGASSIDVLVSVTNKGPVDCAGVEVFIRRETRSSVGSALLSGPTQGSFAGDTWFVGSLAIGQTETMTLRFSALSNQVPHAVRVALIEAQIVDSVERRIFTFDDQIQGSIDGERRSDFALTHQLIVRKKLLPDLTRNDSAELTLFVTNNGPSHSDLVVVQIASRMPDGVHVVGHVVDGKVLAQQRVIFEGRKAETVLDGEFHFWLAGALRVGQTSRLTVFLAPRGSRSKSAPLNVGAAISVKHTAPTIFINQIDDAVNIRQAL